MGAYLEGRWRKACELLDRGENVLRDSCTGVTWELDTAMSFHLRSLLFIGDFLRIRERLPRFLKDVREKGDLYAEVNLRSRVVWVTLLAADRPQDAQREVDDAIERWSQNGFHLQHYWHMTGVVEIALYRGDSKGAWRHLEETWPAFEKSMLQRIQLTRTEAWVLRCRTALAAAIAHGFESPAGLRLLKQSTSDLRQIEKQKLSGPSHSPNWRARGSLRPPETRPKPPSYSS